jgi:hypothetical protein
MSLPGSSIGEAPSMTLLTVTSSVTAFTALMPPFGEVRKAHGDPDIANDVRMAELAATGLVVAIGLSASAFSKSPVPAMAAVVFSIALVVLYESVLAANPKGV